MCIYYTLYIIYTTHAISKYSVLVFLVMAFACYYPGFNTLHATIVCD